MSKTHRRVVVQVPPSVLQTSNAAVRSGDEEKDGVHLSVARSARSIDDVDHVFVKRSKDSAEEAFRVDALATSDKQAAACLAPSLIAACFGDKKSGKRGSPGGRPRSGDAMVFCAATPRVDHAKVDGQGLASAFAEHAAGIGTHVAEDLALEMLEAARADLPRGGGGAISASTKKVSVVGYSLLLYDLQPFAGYTFAAVDLLQDISEGVAPRKLPLGTMQSGERAEGAAFVDGLIEAECEVHAEAGKTRNLLKRILSRLAEGRATLARSPAMCLGIGWAPIASVIRLSLEPTRRSLTIVELEGSLFVGSDAGGCTSPAMQRTLSALEAFVRHGLQAGGHASDDTILSLLLDKALSNASTPWWTIFGNAIISGSLLRQPWLGACVECSPLIRRQSSGEAKNIFDDATENLLAFTSNFFPGAVDESPDLDLLISPDLDPTMQTSPVASLDDVESPPPRTPLSPSSSSKDAMVVPENLGDADTSFHQPDGADGAELVQDRHLEMASIAEPPLAIYLETQRHLTSALRKEQETRLIDMEGLRNDNEALRTERGELLKKLETATTERDKFRDNFLLGQYEAQVMRKTLDTLKKEKDGLDESVQILRAPRPLLREAFEHSWVRVSNLEEEVGNLTAQLETLQASEKSLKRLLETSQIAHEALLETHRQCTKNWKEEEARLTDRLTAAEVGMAAFPMTTSDYYGLIDESGGSGNGTVDVEHLLRAFAEEASPTAGSTSKKSAVKSDGVGGLPDAISFWTEHFQNRSLVPWSPDFESALRDGRPEEKDQNPFSNLKVALCDHNDRVSYSAFISYAATLRATDTSFGKVLLESEKEFDSRGQMLYVTVLDPETHEPIPSSRTFVMVQSQESLSNVRTYLDKLIEEDVENAEGGVSSFVKVNYSFHLIGIGDKEIATIKVPRSQEHQISCADVLKSGVGISNLRSNALQQALQPVADESALHVQDAAGNGANGKTHAYVDSTHSPQQAHGSLSETDMTDIRNLVSSAGHTSGANDLFNLIDRVEQDNGGLDPEVLREFVQGVLEVPQEEVPRAHRQRQQTKAANGPRVALHGVDGEKTRDTANRPKWNMF